MAHKPNFWKRGKNVHDVSELKKSSNAACQAVADIFMLQYLFICLIYLSTISRMTFLSLMCNVLIPFVNVGGITINKF
jgi:hypothetical protein